VSDTKYIYILVRYSPAGVGIVGATAIFSKAQDFERKHPDNRAIPVRMETISTAPLEPMNPWPRTKFPP